MSDLNELNEDDSPEWTQAAFAEARRDHHLLPDNVQALIRRRGSQAAPTKRQVTLRLSPQVIEAFRATGKGWQTRIDAALKAHLGLAG